jgi:hypothetical protein
MSDPVTDNTATTTPGSETIGLLALRGGIITEADYATEQGCCRESIRRAIKAGLLPPSIRLPGGRGWLRDVLFEYLKKRHEAAQIEAQTKAAEIAAKISRLST